MGDSVSATIPSNVPPAEPPVAATTSEPGTTTTTTTTQPDSFAHPEGFKDKSYLKGVDSQEKLYTLLDNSQKLIGKRPAGIPQDTATPEEWDKFYASLGRPETAEKYEFAEVELPEGMEKNVEMEAVCKSKMHELGLSQKQAQGLQSWFDAYVAEQYTAQAQAKETQEQEFNELVNSSFGAEKDAILANAKALLSENIPKGFENHVDNLPNESLIILAGVLNNVKKKYIDEDKVPGGTADANSSVTIEEKRAEALKLQQLPEYQHKHFPGHKAVYDKVQRLYEEIAPRTK
jgi:hypothetical protein